MKTRIASAIILVIFILASFPSTARADGIIIPEPPICDPAPCPPLPLPMSQLAIRYHHVTVTIQDQLAITHIDQVFYNPNDWTVEGTYIFPLPLDAAVSDFRLWIDNEPVQGKVLAADEARQQYEEIVRTLRDPALLEYEGRGAVQASIYPIPPEGERRIELEYTQVLTAENGLVKYVYPLNTEKFSAVPLEDVSVSVDITSTQPIRAVYSPTHDVEVNRDSDTHVLAGYEEKGVLPDTDFALYYSIGENEAFHLFTYRDTADPTDPDGFFLLLLAPKPEIASTPVPKDVFLVLDRSGSMEGDKFRQAQEALRTILRHLNIEDRFNIITFSTGLETYSSTLNPADEANEAIAWVDALSAQGSTDINRALLEVASLADRERPTYLLFLTDGLPTQGEVDSQKILGNFARSAPDNLRLFSFGVGYDVDTVLLDSLAQEHHGTSSYVRPGEALDEVISAFYAKISTPVLTDLALDFAGVTAYDIYPSPLPDLFLGSQIIVVGRYRQGGTADVTLTGSANGAIQSFRYPDQVFDDGQERSSSFDTSQSSIPRLWATRKIGYLLSQVRLKGADEETVDQIVALSIRYGIVTPYTSYLVTEPMPLGEGAREQIVEDEMYRLLEPSAVTGADAVNKAADQGAMQGAGAPVEAPAEAASRVRTVGSRTFVLAGGVWTDTTYDPNQYRPQPISFLSEDYFTLAEDRPDLAPVLALGPRVLFLLGNQAYEIVDSGAPAGPVKLPSIQPPVKPTPTADDQIVPGITPEPEQPGPTPTPRVPISQVLPSWPAFLLPVIVIFFLASVVVKAKKAGS